MNTVKKLVKTMASKYIAVWKEATEDTHVCCERFVELVQQVWTISGERTKKNIAAQKEGTP